MKSVLGAVSRIMFYVFCIVVIVWTGSLTISFVSTVLPGNEITPWLALMVFDGGSLTWMLVFLFRAEGLPQRAISLLMTVLCLIGTGVMTMAALFLSGQSYFVVTGNLGELATWTIALSTFVNMCAAYAFHIASPDAAEEITRKNASDRVKSLSLKYLEKSLDEISSEVAGELGETLKADALRQLGVKNGERFQVPMLSGNGHGKNVRVYEQDVETVNPTGKVGK